MTVTLLLVLCALAVTIAAAIGRAPIWAAVLILVIIELLRDIK
jgi:hypothetical protein